MCSFPAGSLLIAAIMRVRFLSLSLSLSLSLCLHATCVGVDHDAVPSRIIVSRYVLVTPARDQQ
jgi:hypothetical protein